MSRVLVAWTKQNTDLRSSHYHHARAQRIQLTDECNLTVWGEIVYSICLASIQVNDLSFPITFGCVYKQSSFGVVDHIRFITELYPCVYSTRNMSTEPAGPWKLFKAAQKIKVQEGEEEDDDYSDEDLDSEGFLFALFCLEDMPISVSKTIASSKNTLSHPCRR